MLQKACESRIPLPQGSQNVTFSSFRAQSPGVVNVASLATTQKLLHCLAASLLTLYVRAADGSPAGRPVSPPEAAFRGRIIMARSQAHDKPVL